MLPGIHDAFWLIHINSYAINRGRADPLNDGLHRPVRLPAGADQVLIRASLAGIQCYMLYIKVERCANKIILTASMTHKIRLNAPFFLCI